MASMPSAVLRRLLVVSGKRSSPVFAYKRPLTTSSFCRSASSVDPADVDRFAALSDRWWREQGAFKPLHSMNRLRVPWIAGALQPLSGKLVVDVGCGAGLLTEPLARLGAVVTGVDACEEAITVARQRREADPDLCALTLEYEQGAVEDFVRSGKGAFDALVASEVVEHVADLETFLDACVELVKPDGHLFFTTINRTMASRLLAIFMAERVLGIVPEGVHQWEKFVPPDELAVQLETRDCRVRLVNGMRYNPLVNSWQWTRDTSVNYALMARKN